MKLTLNMDSPLYRARYSLALVAYCLMACLLLSKLPSEMFHEGELKTYLFLLVIITPTLFGVKKIRDELGRGLS